MTIYETMLIYFTQVRVFPLRRQSRHRDIPSWVDHLEQWHKSFKKMLQKMFININFVTAL